MLGLGAPEIGLIILAILLLFGYKKLPDASRSLGRSLRIFKGEMKGMKDDDVRTRDEARTSPVTGQLVPPVTQVTPMPPVTPVTPPLVDYEAEARAAELRAAEARARAEQARASAAADTQR
jgi:sec-independent protein translocase protein TatA